ncbi:MAG: polysaccharide deacetylase family protein [Magnetococcales bacterium]|nr:polysaccharide deacetylase family protein [Magnetococcales bacterium]
MTHPGEHPLRVLFFLATPPTPGALWLLHSLADCRNIILDGMVVTHGHRCHREEKSLLKRGTYRFPGHWAGQGPGAPVRQAIRAMEQAFLEDHPPSSTPLPSWIAWCRDSALACDNLEETPSEVVARRLRQRPPDLGILLDDAWRETPLLSIPRWGSLKIHVGPLLPDGVSLPPALPELLASGDHLPLTLRWWGSPYREDGTVVARRDLTIEPCATLESLAILAAHAGVFLLHDHLVACASRPGSLLPTFNEARNGEMPAVPESPLPALPAAVTRISLREETISKAMPDAELSTPVPLLTRRIARQRRRRILEMQRYRHISSETWTAALIAQATHYLQGRQASRERLDRLSAVGDAPILFFYYHRTANDHGHGITLPLEEFVRQVTFMRQHADLLSVEAAIERLESGRNTRLAVALTIDDGYASDLETALPWLDIHGHPATLFISPGLMLQRATPLGFDLMTPDDLRRLRSRGFGIGSHTMWHADLGQNTGKQVDFELQRSQEILEEILGEPVLHFAFPFGVHDRNITGEAFAKARLRYRYLHSAYGGYNFPSRFDGVHVRRFATPHSVLEVARLLAGFVPVWMDAQQAVPWETPSNSLPPYTYS